MALLAHAGREARVHRLRAHALLPRVLCHSLLLPLRLLLRDLEGSALRLWVRSNFHLLPHDKDNSRAHTK